MFYLKKILLFKFNLYSYEEQSPTKLILQNMTKTMVQCVDEDY